MTMRVPEPRSRRMKGSPTISSMGMEPRRVLAEGGLAELTPRQARKEDDALLAVEPVERQVAGDLEDEGREVVFLAVVGQVLVDLQEGFLGDAARLVGVGGHARHEKDDARGVAPHQDLEVLAAAAQHGGDHLVIGRLRVCHDCVRM
jgi:hypothetical protein